jgi:hypothetical protein
MQNLKGGIMKASLSLVIKSVAALLVICATALAQNFSAPNEQILGDAEDLFSITKSDRLTLTTPEGYWQLPDRAQNGFTFSLRFRLKSNEITVANRCMLGHQVAYVATTVPVILTPDTLQIIGSSRNTVNVGGLNCDVQVLAGPAQRYEVVNGIMNIEGSSFTALKLQDL